MTRTRQQMQTDSLFDRPMPSNPGAERAILGAVLINNHSYYRLGELTVDDFAFDANRLIFEAMAYMADVLNVDIHPITLKAELMRRGTLDAVGGIAYATSLMDFVPDVANVERYVKMVLRESKRRRNIKIGNQLMRGGFDDANEPEDDATEALGRLGAVATKEDSQAKPLVDVLQATYDRRRQRAAEGKSPAFDCGLPTLNEHHVFRPTFVVITAAKGSGKSALMTALASNLAAKGHRNAMFSLESSGDDIGGRYESMETGIPHTWVRDPRLPQFTDSHHARVMECHRIAGQRGIFLSERLSYLEKIILEIRRLHAMYQIQVAQIDYVQLVKVAQRFDRDERKYAYIAQEMLAVARELGITVCAFSQVNKEGNVALADAIEQTARVRVHFERSKETPCAITLSIVKNNEGRTNGGFLFHFNETTQQWGEGTCADNGHGTSSVQLTLRRGDD